MAPITQSIDVFVYTMPSSLIQLADATMGKPLYTDSCSPPTDISEDPRSRFDDLDGEFTDDNVQLQRYLEMEAAVDYIERARGVFRANKELDPNREGSFWTDDWNEIAEKVRRDKQFLRRTRRNSDENMGSSVRFFEVYILWPSFFFLSFIILFPLICRYYRLYDARVCVCFDKNRNN